MNWANGFTAKYYVSEIDPITWRDIERFDVISGDIRRTDSNLVESADIECNHRLEGETWVRIWLDAKQIGDSVHTPLFTGLATSPETRYNGNLAFYNMQCYSVLKPASDILLDRGWYANTGISGADYVKSLLEVIPAPVTIVGDSPRLNDYIIAEDGENHLTMAYKILNAINWRLRINGAGEITICEKATEPVARFDTLDYDVIETEIDIEHDWYECPNVFRAVLDDTSATARDDSPDSVLSTVNRGREIWQEENNCNLNENETLAEYAYRRLKEEQQNVVSIKYDRRYNPDVTVGDIVRLNYPKQNAVGLFSVTDQTIKLGYGAQTSEEVVQA